MIHKLTDKQQARLKWACQIMRLIPQVKGPLWLIKILDRILPNQCPFYKVWYYRGVLVLYVPPLCQLNPFYNTICEYRYENTEEVPPLP